MKDEKPLEVTPAEARRMTRRVFATAALAALGGAAGWWWLRTREADDDLPWPLRAAHRFNERVGRALFSERNLAPEFPPERAVAEPRVNGGIGRPTEPPADWSMRVEDGTGVQTLTLPQLFGDLERVEMTTELMCVEGWSQVMTWGGVRFRDAVRKHGWPTRLAYVGLETADGVYGVGLDLASALHPQTLLCDRLNGEPLPFAHGGPLRLVIPVKYGIKNLKWLAKLRFTDERPTDYWAARGYDWFAGL